MFQKVFFGPNANPKNQHLRDLSARELAVFAPIVLGIFLMGFFPRPFLGAMEPSVNRLRRELGARIIDSNAHPDEVRYLGPPLAPPPPPPKPAAASPPGEAPGAVK